MTQQTITTERRAGLDRQFEEWGRNNPAFRVEFERLRSLARQYTEERRQLLPLSGLNDPATFNNAMLSHQYRLMNAVSEGIARDNTHTPLQVLQERNRSTTGLIADMRSERIERLVLGHNLRNQITPARVELRERNGQYSAVITINDHETTHNFSAQSFRYIDAATGTEMSRLTLNPQSLSVPQAYRAMHLGRRADNTFTGLEDAINSALAEGRVVHISGGLGNTQLGFLMGQIDPLVPDNQLGSLLRYIARPEIRYIAPPPLPAGPQPPRRPNQR